MSIECFSAFLIRYLIVGILTGSTDAGYPNGNAIPQRKLGIADVQGGPTYLILWPRGSMIINTGPSKVINDIVRV